MRPLKLFAPDDRNGGEEEIVIENNKVQTDNLDELDKQIEELVNKPDEPEQIEPSDTPDETDKDIIDDTSELDDQPDKQIKDETDVKKGPEDSPDNPPDKDKEIETDKNQQVITEEYINSLGLSPELATKLNKFIGKPFQELAKSLAHAQTLIGKKKEDLLKAEDISKPAKVDITEQQIKQAQTPDEINQAKDDLVYNELVKDFPELPKDPVERKKYLADMNYEDPEQYDSYRDKVRDIRKDVDEVWKQTVYLRENHDKIIDKQVKDTASSIENYFKEVLQLEPKELGYDFTLDEKGDNPIISQLLSDPNNPNEFDPKVLVNYNGVTLINQQALISKFRELETPKIITKIRTSARKEGFTSATQKKVAPSMATQPMKGKENKELKTDKIKELNDVHQIDKLLDELDNQ